MNGTISIRQTIEADLAVWARLRHQLWNDLSAADHLAELAAERSAATLTGYLAFSPESETIAFAEVSLRPYANGATAKPVPFLEGIWVASPWRRHGVGRQLVTAIMADLRAAGFQELCSDAEIDNHDSLAAHRQWGFDETERVVCFRKSLLP